MKNILTIIYIALFVSSGLAKAGGSIGGGSGLVLELQTPDISYAQFSALFESQDLPIWLNSYQAKVRAVDLHSKTVVLDVEGFEVPTVLRVLESNPSTVRE